MKTFVDDFVRADAALNGSTLSGGGATWVASTWAIASNRAQTSNLGAFGSGVAMVSAEADTDDVFTRVTLSSFTSQASDLLALNIIVGAASDRSTGYVATLSRETDGSGAQVIKRLSDDVVLASATVAAYTSGEFELRRIAGQLVLLKDGVIILGPVGPGVPEPTGAGNRYSGFSAFCLNGSTPNLVEASAFAAGDRVIPAAIFPSIIRPGLFTPGTAR